MNSFKVTIAYDGGGFVGWQRQADGVSVQGLIEGALSALDERAVTVAGAGRTDAGVHALGQVASFSLERAIECDVLVRALNAHLPAEVRVVSADAVPPTFHARFGATSKTYRYRIWTGPVVSPFERAYVWHVPGPLSIEAMQEAAQALEGRRDFAAFQAAGRAPGSTERTVTSSLVAFDRADDCEGLLTYTVTGDGFLRHMVRTIVGSLVEIGRGRRAAAWMAQIVASRDRAQAGPTAPAHGLFLVRVDYPVG